MVVSVSTMSTEGSCASASVAGTKGDSSYTQVPSALASASYSSSGLKNCAYSAIFYATATSTGSDKITVTLSSSLSSSQGDTSVVIVYEINSVMMPFTGTSGSCNNGACSLTVQTSSLSTSANSFLATTAADCQSPTGHQRDVTAGPTSFVTDYGTGDAEYSGHEIPGSASSQTFSMTSSTGMSGNPVCWSVVGAQFLDPPISSAVAPAAMRQSPGPGGVVLSPSALGSGDILGVSVLSVCVMPMALEFPKKTKTRCKHDNEAEFKQ
jgi:hypothetical protein